MKLVCLVLGGSINPITIAHLRMLVLAKEYVTEALGNPVKAIISPVGDNYPGKKLAPAALRVQMARAAVADQDWITVDDWESRQTSWIRTVDLLNHFQDQLPDAAITFVAGTDLIHSFERPGLWKDEDLKQILTKFGILVIKRAGTEEYKHVHPLLKNYQYAQRLIPLDEWMPNHISSTLLRQAIKEGKSIKYWTPDAVIKIIDENSLYKE